MLTESDLCNFKLIRKVPSYSVSGIQLFIYLFVCLFVCLFITHSPDCFSVSANVENVDTVSGRRKKQNLLEHL